MKSVKILVAGAAAAAVIMFAAAPALKADAETPWNGWYEENGNKYWYENGVRQGTEGRGKEIYDPGSDAWYWLDAVNNGAMAVSKDVYQDSSGGKWVRYDGNGHMVKGWDKNGNGTYYFDLITGAMCKGEITIDGLPCVFDKDTGIGLDCKWYQYEPNGVKYWYEGGRRQGYDPKNSGYRGKEIYDPASNAWYWLDNVDQGKMAVSKDVYQESYAGEWGDVVGEDGRKYGKWVRYDANGHMIKGANTKDGKQYRFDQITGAMCKGWYTEKDSAGKEHTFYYDKVTGEMRFGALELDGKNYLIDNNGYLVKGVVESGGAKFRYDEKTGEMVKGWYEEKDSAGKKYTYYYNPSTGKMTCGAIEIDGEHYMFDSNGHMVTGWCTVGDKKYYYDPSTGAMAKGIVKIEGVVQSFDEKTGEYRGKYEGGEISYNWALVREVRTDSEGKSAGSVEYKYTKNGNLEEKSTRNKDKLYLTKDTYTYDAKGNVATHTYQDFTNGAENYTETYVYDESSRVKTVTVTDRNKSTTWIKEYLYENGRLWRMNVNKGDGSLYNFIIYERDDKGRIEKEHQYTAANVYLGYTHNTYYNFDGQSFTRTSYVYEARGNNEVAFLSGVEYKRSGYDLTEEIVYTGKQEVSTVTKYKVKAFPTGTDEKTFEKESETRDKAGKLLYQTVYEYELKEFVQ